MLLKLLPGSDKAPLEGDAVSEARRQDEYGRPAIKVLMTAAGSKTREG